MEPPNPERFLPFGKDGKFSHIVVVTGEPGNRSDFVAGWLSNSNPQRFGFAPWRIEPVWGKSFITTMIEWRELNMWFDNQKNEIVNRVFLTGIMRNTILDHHGPSAPTIVTKSHFSSFYMQQIIPREYKHLFTFVDILTGPDDFTTVCWEDLVKNIFYWYGSTSFQDKRLQEIVRKRVKGLVTRLTGMDDTSLTDDISKNIEIYLRFLKDLSPKDRLFGRMNQEHLNSSLADPDLNVLKIDYSELMHRDGYKRLIDYFMLPEKHADDLWKKTLSVAKSADRIYSINRWWQNPWAE